MYEQKESLADQFIRENFSHEWPPIIKTWFGENPAYMSEIAAKYNGPSIVTFDNAFFQHAARIMAVQGVINIDAAIVAEFSVARRCANKTRIETVRRWFTVRCYVCVETLPEPLNVSYVGDGYPDELDDRRYTADANFVPLIFGKEDLEREARLFLEYFCPDALRRPMAVDIRRIAEERAYTSVIAAPFESMGEDVIGQMCFGDTPISFTCPASGGKMESIAKWGTLIVNTGAGRDMNEGCINNTIAHELFHWHRHRVYAVIQSKMNGGVFKPCNRTARRTQRGEGASDHKPDRKRWTNEERLEWQANGVAPRILMPAEMFKQKAAELFERYRDFYRDRYEGLTHAVVRQLAAFFKVSRESAGYRLEELCGNAQSAPKQNEPAAETFTHISRLDAYRLYRENKTFAKVLDSGVFRYSNGQFVPAQFVPAPFAAEVGALKFRKRLAYTFPANSRLAVFRSKRREMTDFGSGDNASIVNNLVELKRRIEVYRSEIGDFRTVNTTFCDLAKTLMDARHWNSAIFKEMTHLDAMTYSRIMRGQLRKPNIPTVAAICVGLDIDVDIADKLYAAAGHNITPEEEDYGYHYLHIGFRDCDIDECNVFLEAVGLAPLGCRSYKERPLPETAAAVNG